ncbi:hypothetical protein [Taylorella equigenitalis]|nr:hypothetical protein [Taylorella equigenitalis]
MRLKSTWKLRFGSGDGDECGRLERGYVEVKKPLPSFAGGG